MKFEIARLAKDCNLPEAKVREVLRAFSAQLDELMSNLTKETKDIEVSHFGLLTYEDVCGDCRWEVYIIGDSDND